MSPLKTSSMSASFLYFSSFAHERQRQKGSVVSICSSPVTGKGNIHLSFGIKNEGTFRNVFDKRFKYICLELLQ